jgi:hypothetical protein
MSDLNDAAYWWERADQARHIAGLFADDGARKQMIRIAEGYEEMAKMAQQLKLRYKGGSGFLFGFFQR